MEPQVLTVESAAEYLGLSADSIYKAVRLGRLKTLDVRGRHILFTSVQLEEYLALRRNSGLLDGSMTPADGVRITELADLANTSPRALRSLRHRGKLGGVKVLGRVLVPWDEARRFLQARGVDAEDRLVELQRRKQEAAEAA